MFASSLRQKVLWLLFKNGKMRVMKLVSAAGTTYNELNRTLTILAKEDLITDEYEEKVRHAKVRVIALKRDNPKTDQALKVLKMLNEEKKPTIKKPD